MSQHIRYTEFWNDVMHEIYGPRKGGAKILIDAKDAKLGAGKTSAQAAVIVLFAKTFDYEIEPEDLTLAGEKYRKRRKEHPKNSPSVMGLDELVGAGAGDARRAMSNANKDLASSWQLERTRQIVTAATLPSWTDADKRLRKLADYRLLCEHRPIGHFIPYKLGTFDFDESSRIKFERLGGRISFPNMEGHPVYEYLSREKDELIDSDTYDANELGEDEDEGEEEEELTPRDVVEKVKDAGVGRVVSIHGGNKQPYIDQDLIEADFGVGEENARKARKLLNRDIDVENYAPQPA